MRLWWRDPCGSERGVGGLGASDDVILDIRWNLHSVCEYIGSTAQRRCNKEDDV